MERIRVGLNLGSEQGQRPRQRQRNYRNQLKRTSSHLPSKLRLSCVHRPAYPARDFGRRLLPGNPGTLPGVGLCFDATNASHVGSGQPRIQREGSVSELSYMNRPSCSPRFTGTPADNGKAQPKETRREEHHLYRERTFGIRADLTVGPVRGHAKSVLRARRPMGEKRPTRSCTKLHS